LPAHIAGADLRQGTLVPLLRRYQDGPEVGIVYRPNRSLPSRVRVLNDFLVERFEPKPACEEGW